MGFRADLVYRSPDRRWACRWWRDPMAQFRDGSTGTGLVMADPAPGGYSGQAAVEVSGVVPGSLDSQFEPCFVTVTGDARCQSRSPMNDLSSPLPWPELLGQIVVVDLRSPFVCLGRLSAVQGEFLVLTEADLHDLRDTSTTRERYVRDGEVHGIHANRRRTWVSLREVVAITRLEDIASG